MKSSTSVLLEKPTPRLVIDDIPKTLWAIAIVAFWERFSFWGVTVPFQNHMEHPWSSGSHEKPGVLGLGQSMATSVNCAFRILYYVTPIIWAVVSDSWLGRYKSLCYTFILYILGIGVLVGSSFYVAVERGFALPGLLLAMVLIALGGGGCRAIMVPFIADQYVNREPRLKTLKSGEVVITDPVLTLEYIYSLYFWLGNLGSFSIIASTYIEMHVSFWCAYSICLGAMIIALIILLGGRNYYSKLTAHLVQREENILPAATRILICAARNSFKLKRATPEYQSQLCGVSVPWSEKTVTELGRVLRTCKILLAFVVFWTCFDQMDTNLISQASHLISGPIPNDMMTVINAAGCVVFGPIIQSGLYPILRRHNIVFKPMLKITVGFAIIALSMGYAAIVQGLIYSASPDRISVWIQAPIYIFIAVGEIFCYVTALEYADSHAPEGMRVLVQAISLVIAGIGNALAMALSPLARDPNLIAFYGALLGAMTATTVGFWFWFREYDNLEHSDSMIGEIEQSLEMDIEKASSM
ncbi:POT family-domain-containing protein, partial [Dendryphion nanum]